VSEQPRPGDRVRITYEAEYRSDWEAVGKDGTVIYPADAVVEVVEPADDPSKDPEGTYRRSDSGVVVARLDEQDESGVEWVVVFRCGATDRRMYDHREVTGWPVIGAVPGTPAAEAQRHDMGYCGTCKVVHDEREPAVQLSPHGWEPRVFQSDGPEPPEDVKALRWLDRDPGARWEYLIHTRSGWVWAPSPTTRPLLGPGAHWDTATRACRGRYEEVQP
jgi:hypothetical protein